MLPSMYPEIAHVGPFTIHAWGLLVALGFLAGILLAAHRAPTVGLTKEHVFDISFFTLLASILGARALYVIQFWDQFAYQPLEILMVQNGGLVFFGGMLGALTTIVIYAKWRNISLLKLLDLATLPVFLGYAIGRLGCFLNGCCYGQPTDLPWGVTFQPGSEAYWRFGSTPLHPTQLYAAGTSLIIFLVLLLCAKKIKREGNLFAWGLLCYALYRFTIEWIRANPAYWFGLTLSQYGALLLLLVALYLLLLRPHRKHSSL